MTPNEVESNRAQFLQGSYWLDTRLEHEKVFSAKVMPILLLGQILQLNESVKDHSKKKR